jgi:hypothetical protein
MGVPIVVGALTIWFRWDLSKIAESLIGGYALAAGVLIAVFTQVAAWRNRLDERADRRPESEAPARRAVDGAAAHALWAVVVSVGAVAVTAVLEIGTPFDRWLSGLSALLGTYLLGLLLLIVSSAFVGYESNVDPAVREADNDRLRPNDKN